MHNYALHEPLSEVVRLIGQNLLRVTSHLRGAQKGPVAATGGNGHGSLGIVSSAITFPSGTIAPMAEVPAGQSYIRFRLNGTPDRNIQAQDVQSGASVRIEGTVIYRMQ